MKRLLIILFLFGTTFFVQGQKYVRINFNITGWDGRQCFAGMITIETDNTRENKIHGVAKFQQTYCNDSLITLKIPVSKFQNRTVRIIIHGCEMSKTDTIENITLTNGQVFNVRLEKNPYAICPKMIQGILLNNDSLNNPFLVSVFSSFYPVQQFPCFSEFYHDDYYVISFDIDKIKSIKNVRIIKNIPSGWTSFIFEYLECVEKFMKKENDGKPFNPIYNIKVRLDCKDFNN